MSKIKINNKNGKILNVKLGQNCSRDYVLEKVRKNKGVSRGRGFRSLQIAVVLGNLPKNWTNGQSISPYLDCLRLPKCGYNLPDQIKLILEDLNPGDQVVFPYFVDCSYKNFVCKMFKAAHFVVQCASRR